MLGYSTLAVDFLLIYALCSNGGGGDPNTAVAWEVALGAIDTFDGLLDYDLMSMIHVLSVALL